MIIAEKSGVRNKTSNTHSYSSSISQTCEGFIERKKMFSSWPLDYVSEPRSASYGRSSPRLGYTHLRLASNVSSNKSFQLHDLVKVTQSDYTDQELHLEPLWGSKYKNYNFSLIVFIDYSQAFFSLGCCTCLAVLFEDCESVLLNLKFDSVEA